MEKELRKELCCIINPRFKCLACPRVWCAPCWGNGHNQGTHYTASVAASYAYPSWMSDHRRKIVRKGLESCLEGDYDLI